MTDQQNNTSDNIFMNYRQIPFNMTIAKRISDGSVLGRVNVFNRDGIDLGRAIWAYNNPYGEVFTILPSSADDEHDVPYIVCFNDKGKSIGNYDRDALALVTSIPVDDTCGEDCDETVLVKEDDPHYHKCKIEPIEYILANKLGFCEGNVVKYITRYKDKGGIDDLRKIKVYVDFLIDDLTK